MTSSGNSSTYLDGTEQHSSQQVAIDEPSKAPSSSFLVVNDPMGFNIVNMGTKIGGQNDDTNKQQQQPIETTGIYTNIIQLSKQLVPSMSSAITGTTDNDDQHVVASGFSNTDVVVTIEMDDDDNDTTLSPIIVKEHEGYTIAVQMLRPSIPSTNTTTTTNVDTVDPSNIPQAQQHDAITTTIQTANGIDDVTHPTQTTTTLEGVTTDTTSSGIDESSGNYSRNEDDVAATIATPLVDIESSGVGTQ